MGPENEQKETGEEPEVKEEPGTDGGEVATEDAGEAEEGREEEVAADEGEVDEDTLKELLGTGENADKAPEPKLPDGMTPEEFEEFKAWKSAKAAPAAEKKPDIEDYPDEVDITEEEFGAIFEDDGREPLKLALNRAAKAGHAAAARQFRKEMAAEREDMFYQMVKVNELMLEASQVYRAIPEIKGREEVFGKLYHRELAKGLDPETAAQNAGKLFKTTYAKYEAIKKSGRILDLRGQDSAPATKVGSARQGGGAETPTDDQRRLGRMAEVAASFRKGW